MYNLRLRCNKNAIAFKSSESDTQFLVNISQHPFWETLLFIIEQNKCLVENYYLLWTTFLRFTFFHFYLLKCDFWWSRRSIYYTYRNYSHVNVTRVKFVNYNIISNVCSAAYVGPLWGKYTWGNVARNYNSIRRKPKYLDLLMCSAKQTSCHIINAINVQNMIWLSFPSGAYSISRVAEIQQGLLYNNKCSRVVNFQLIFVSALQLACLGFCFCYKIRKLNVSFRRSVRNVFVFFGCTEARVEIIIFGVNVFGATRDCLLVTSICQRQKLLSFPVRVDPLREHWIKFVTSIIICSSSRRVYVTFLVRREARVWRKRFNLTSVNSQTASMFFVN